MSRSAVRWRFVPIRQAVVAGDSRDTKAVILKYTCASSRLCDPVFDEAAITIVAVPFRMSSSQWTLAGRISWICGGSSRKPITQAKARASEAAEVLAQASAKGDAVLIGHGWMNRMIGAELQSRGFVRVGTASGGHWSATSLHR